MFSYFYGKINSSVTVPLDTKYEINQPEQLTFQIEDLPIKKMVIISHPILKTLGLLLLFGATTALSSASLINPIVEAEVIRLIFICVIALLLQRESNSRLYYQDRVVKTFLYS
jgi:hypothetical protein